MPVYRNRETQQVAGVNGGEGTMTRDRLLTEDQLKEVGGEVTYVSQITLDPHSSLGIHEHVGEGELYFITEGEGVYTEDGFGYNVVPGDALFCKDGSTHGIKNISDKPLKFVAVIMKAPTK